MGPNRPTAERTRTNVWMKTGTSSSTSRELRYEEKLDGGGYPGVGSQQQILAKSVPTGLTAVVSSSMLLAVG